MTGIFTARLLNPRKTQSHNFGKIDQPIAVLGAGESVEEFVKNTNLSGAFTIAVDAAVPTLCALNIKIDAIVAVEAQSAILPSYIGAKNNHCTKNALIFADISSRANLAQKIDREIAFFASEFAKTSFFSNLSSKSFFPPKVPPLGSVGLTATYLALLLRKNTDVPIAVAGLDFSFSAGRTHARGTHAENRRLFEKTRLNSDGAFGACFGANAKIENGKSGKIYTDIALFSYAKLFCHTFGAQKNLFDAGKSGIPLNLPPLSNGIFEEKTKSKEKIDFEKNESHFEEILKWLENEEKSLERLRELLSFGEEVAKCGKSASDEIAEILFEREYLYLHFPDGWQCKANDISFLKRVRTEIDFFLKDIKRSISRISNRRCENPPKLLQFSNNFH